MHLIVFILISLPLQVLSSMTPAEEKERFGDQLVWISTAYFHPDELEPFIFWDHGQILNQLRYISRAKYEDGLLIGQFSQKYLKMFTSFLSKEISLDIKSVELLYAPRGTTAWVVVKPSDKRVLSNLILGGIMPRTGENLYVCRAVVQNPSGSHAVSIGYYRFETNRCTVLQGQEELHTEEYEVLTVSAFGIMTGACDEYM